MYAGHFLTLGSEGFLHGIQLSVLQISLSLLKVREN